QSYQFQTKILHSLLFLTPFHHSFISTINIPNHLSIPKKSHPSQTNKTNLFTSHQTFHFYSKQNFLTKAQPFKNQLPFHHTL
ncbi:hypothetical protein, partial [Bacillus pumilus]|uniref:hypothetical protein n=1 Tax=Bacillus pumilus TaxID=1408 RepID=UPI001C92EE86